jgi:hypothetical protein
MHEKRYQMKTNAELEIEKLATEELLSCISRLSASTHSPNSPLRKLAAKVFNVPVNDTTLSQFMVLSTPLAQEMATRYYALKNGEEEE